MPRGHDGAVVLVVKRGAAKVNHTDSRILHRSLFSLLRDRNRISKGRLTEILIVSGVRPRLTFSTL